MVRDRSDGADPTTVIRSPRSAVSAAGGFSRGSASDSRDVRRYDAGEHTEQGGGSDDGRSRRTGHLPVLPHAVKRGRRGRRSAHRVVDAVWLLWPANVKLDAQHLATEDQEGFYEDEHPAYGHLEPRPPLGYQPVDLRDFDSPLGTEAELESLIGTLHDHGIFVVLDAVLDHMANPRAPTDRWGDADDPLDETHQDWPQFETEEHFTEIPEFGYERPAEEFEDPPFDRSLLKLPSLDVRHPKYGKLTRRTSGRRSGSVPTASGSTPPSTSGRGTGGT